MVYSDVFQKKNKQKMAFMKDKKEDERDMDLNLISQKSYKLLLSKNEKKGNSENVKPTLADWQKKLKQIFI